MELNTQLDEKWIKELEEDAKNLSLDRDALIKKILIDGLKQLRIKKLLPLYELGELSLEQLAFQLELSIYEVITLLKIEKIPIGLSLTQTKEELAVLQSD